MPARRRLLQAFPRPARPTNITGEVNEVRLKTERTSEGVLTMRTLLSRRDFIKTSAVAAGLQLPEWRTRAAAQSARTIARGPFQPTWESLVQNYRVPEWFRDAKFGVWA